jgi:hypothetical protein
MMHSLEQLRAEQRAEVAITGYGEMSPEAGEENSSILYTHGHERWDDDPSEFEDWDEFSGSDFGDLPGSSYFNWIPATGKRGNDSSSI